MAGGEGLVDFEHGFDFDRCAQGEGVGSDGGAGVATGFAEDGGHEFAGAVGDLGLVDEGIAAGDEHAEPDHLPDALEVADGRLCHGEDVEGAHFCRVDRLFECDLDAGATGGQKFTVAERQLAGDEEQVAAADTGDVRGDGLGGHRQGEPEGGEGLFGRSAGWLDGCLGGSRSLVVILGRHAAMIPAVMAGGAKGRGVGRGGGVTDMTTSKASAVDTAKVTGRRRVEFATLADAFDDARRCAEADLSGRLRRLGNWTTGQTLGHLAWWIEHSYTGFPFKVPLVVRLVGPFLKGRVLGPRPQAGVRIPGAPEGTYGVEVIPTAEALARLDAAYDRLARSAPPRPNPVFGPLTHAEWTVLHLRHAENHLSLLVPGES